MKIEASNRALSGAQKSSSKPAVQSPQKHRVEVDALATTGREPKGSVGLAFNQSTNRPGATAPVLVPPAAKQGPFARLPLELKEEVLSWLRSESKQVQQLPRAVSRAFYQASAAGLPAVNDRIASGYLRRILRQENFTHTDELETFFIEHAPKMRAIDLTGSYRQESPAKAALLHRVLSHRDVALQSIVLRDCTAVRELPQELAVGGGLDLRGTDITYLPQGLTVGGGLDLRGTDITHLPQGLTVGGALYLYSTRITHLAQGLTVGGDLNLRGTGITQLPQGLTVGGGLDLRVTDITQLSQRLKVGGDLNLRGTDITHLPQGLTVGGDLNLRYTRITHLPQGLTVGGNLDLRDTDITQLPEDLKVTGRIF